MKILHTADWHLGDNFHGFDRYEEHQHFLEWLKEQIQTERPDALLLSGDIFDNANPSAQAQELFYGFLSDAVALNRGMRIILIAGNHDSGRRLQAPSPLLRSLGVEVRGVVEHDRNDKPLCQDLIIPISAIANEQEKAVVLAVPYLRQSDLDRKKPFAQATRDFFTQLKKEAQHLHGKQWPIILMAHLYASKSEVAASEHSERLIVGGEECVAMEDMDSEIAYVALGHIHKAQQIGGDQSMVFYAGSPIPLSFAEKNYEHGINLLTLGSNGGLLFDRIIYTPLRSLCSIPQQGAGSLSEILKEIEQLPQKTKEDSSRWRYLEIQLKESELNPLAQTEILKALEEKAVRLCRIIRQIDKKKATDSKRKAHSLEQLRNISPLDIALDAYLQRTGQEMDDELIARFSKAQKAVEQEAVEQKEGE